MAPGTRQVMEMCDADGCKTTRIDGDCGELGDCLPRLTAFKLKPKNTVRTKQNPLVGLTRPPGRHFVTSGRRRREDKGQRPEEDPRVRVGWGPGAGGAGRHVCSGSRVFEERVIDCVQSR